ncbi:MAG TPA: hypothetical protein DEO65_16475 [Bacillus bacterium]|uniref:Uncharacterized protein n=1 Tax=Siminovitchia fordii TaxID=254759 RepID=A0ABQ4K1Z1_9BACI|nr:hypothetical protein [Siminovitchia fordii]GIN19661.1 hypothetical protein J1TS3_07950 [Siminovitchia fordii]HBZ11432.1 hypothetical protein [Bacillus sp. (in: firmicutes)]
MKKVMSVAACVCTIFVLSWWTKGDAKQTDVKTPPETEVYHKSKFFIVDSIEGARYIDLARKMSECKLPQNTPYSVEDLFTIISEQSKTEETFKYLTEEKVSQ